MQTIKQDAGIARVTGGRGTDSFILTREDGSYLMAEVVAEDLDGRSPAEVVVLDPDANKVLIRISTRVKLNTIERVVADAVAQASAILQDGARTNDNVLDRDGHPGDHSTLSVADHGREAAVRHLDRAKEEARGLRRRRIANEMKVLVENLGLHPDDEVAPQRSAISTVGGDGSIVARHTTPGERRPAWALPPTGYPGWKAFYLLHLPSELAGGTAAGWAIMNTGAPAVISYGVWTYTAVNGVLGTIIKRPHSLADKTAVDTGHGINIKKRFLERAKHRRTLVNPLLERLKTAGISSNPPSEPMVKDGMPKLHQSPGRLFLFRGVPPLAGAVATTPLLAIGLPVWTWAAHMGVAAIGASFGTMHEVYLRVRLIVQEWARLDNAGRQADRTAAEFDEKFVAKLTDILDRLDAINAAASPTGVPTTGSVVDNKVNRSLPTWYGVNQLGGAGDVSRGGFNAVDKHLNPTPVKGTDQFGDPISANAMDVLYTGVTRAGVGALINIFIDWAFVSREYRKIVEQVEFDFGNKMAEQVEHQEKVLTALLAELTTKVEALEAAHRVKTTLPSRTPVPDPEQPPVVTDASKRPVGRQGFVAATLNTGSQAGTLFGVMYAATAIFNQSAVGLDVIGAVAVALLATITPKYLWRRNEQNKVDETVLRDRDRERPIEEREAAAIRELLTEYGLREIEAAETGNTTRNPTPQVRKPADPTNPEEIDTFVADESELLANELRPVALIGARLMALERLARIANRVRIFEAYEQQTGNSKPVTQARTDLAALYDAYQDMTNSRNQKTYGEPMPADHEVLAEDAQERKRNNKPPGFRGGEPGTRPAGDLQSYLDNSVVTPAGRAYYAPGDENLEDADKVRPEPGWYTVDMHGTPYSVVIGADTLTAEDLAALMVADPNWHGEPIRLLACETGRYADGFADQLSDVLGVKVKAPPEYAGVGPGGTVIVTEFEVDASGIKRPVMPPTGHMYIFEPTVLGDPEAEGPAEPPVPPDPPAPPVDPAPLVTRPGLSWPHYDDVQIGEMREMTPAPELGELALLRGGPTVYIGAERLWPDELATIVAESGDWTGGPARVQIREGHVDPEFVQRFADLLGAPVLINSSAVAGDFASLSSGTIEVYNEPSPVEKPLGAWQVYEPRNVAAEKGAPP